eukprot:416070-Prorocentrum_minimum.AAC.3
MQLSRLESRDSRRYQTRYDDAYAIRLRTILTELIIALSAKIRSSYASDLPVLSKPSVSR